MAVVEKNDEHTKCSTKSFNGEMFNLSLFFDFSSFLLSQHPMLFAELEPNPILLFSMLYVT
jgi:hypothetical protein